MNEEEFNRKLRNNKSFKIKVKWYNLGQRRCHICSCQLTWVYHPSLKNCATVEHLVPASKGGQFNSENVLVVCNECNKKRGNKNWLDWINEKQPPKKEWLIDKYINSVKLYKRKNTNIHKVIHTQVNIYIQK
jgi:5-methylcytosine-specific restriction endonuclease McrA